MENLRLAVSACGEKVYIGKVSKDGIRFSGKKKDVTSDFIKAIIDKFKNSTAIIGTKGEIQYEIIVRELPPSTED